MILPRSLRFTVRLSSLAMAAVVLFGAFSTPGLTRLAPLAPPAASQRGTAPHVVYSTLLGGAEGNFDIAVDLAVDAAGNAIIVGQTESSDFPTRNALRDSLEGGQDGFVAKFAPDGTLLFSTFLGGDASDSAEAVAVDASGAIYVAGQTNSDDFPLVNAAQTTPGGFSDAFVTKLSADGSTILYSTRIGGNGIDDVSDLAVDATGVAYVVGDVTPVSRGTATFPLVSPTQPQYGGGASDAFASFLSPDGSGLVFSTLFDAGVQEGRAAGADSVTSVRVASTGDVYVAGNLDYDQDKPEAPFVARFRPVRPGKAQGGPLIYLILIQGFYEAGEGTLEPPEEFGVKLSTFLLLGFSDGNAPKVAGDEPGVLVLADGLCHPARTGGTCDEPAAVAVFDPDLQFNRAENLPVLREFFVDAGTADAQDAVYIAGDVFSNRLTTVNPFQAQYGGNDDVVVAVLAPGTLEAAMVSFFGGDGFDLPQAIATDADGNIFVAGLTTLSTVFPTTPGAFQSMPKGRNDAFLVKISPVGPFPDAPDFSLSFDPATIQVSRGSKVSVPLLIERVGGFTGNVKITPPPQVPGFKSPKKKPTVPGDSTVLKFKVKSDAPLGPTSFTFTGTDPDGRVRSATVTLDVVQ